jgi:anti-sigma-K factor RskA
MAHEEFEQNVALYAAGALDQSDVQALEAHLAQGCQMCWTALKEYRETAGLLPHGLPATAPPPALKSRIETAALAQVLAQSPEAGPDATLRTPDGDVTIRVPPPAAPPGDVTVRLPSQPAETPGYQATVRMTSQQAARQAPAAAAPPSSRFSWMASPALVAACIAFVLGVGAYVFFLHTRLEMETAQRTQAESALQLKTVHMAALREDLEKARRELVESRQHVATTAASLQEAVAQRDQDIERLRAQIEQKEKEVVALYKNASPKDETLAMLQSASVRVLALAGTDAARSAGGLILYDAERGKAFLYAFNMPALPRGKVYQLWAITTKPVSAGTFSADTGRKGRHLVRALPAKSGITKFAVSVEPEGGRPQPTGAIYLHGSL